MGLVLCRLYIRRLGSKRGQAVRCEDVWGSGGILARSRNLGSFSPRLWSLLGNGSHKPVGYCGSQSLSACVKGVSVCPLPGTKFPSSVDSSDVTVMSALFCSSSQLGSKRDVHNPSNVPMYVLF
jgi:hypothetical protein